MEKRLEDIDRNFQVKQAEPPETVFFDCRTPPFVLCGFGETPYCRLSAALYEAPQISDSIRTLMFHAAGGRVRFRTDSPYVAVRVTLGNPSAPPHMTALAAMGADLYAKPEGAAGLPLFTASFLPRLEPDGCVYSGCCRFADGWAGRREITLYLPLYSRVRSVEIGLAEGAEVLPPSPYTVPKPVCFYGSSVTQGACASRPGNTYPAILSRRLDFDFRDLGFSGSAHGEQVLARYIADMELGTLVMEYDYNVVSEEELADTHYAFYRTVRQKQPALPIVMMSAPVTAPAQGRINRRLMETSRLVIMESYGKAKRSGDAHVYFCDGEGILATRDALLDDVHPTDAGMRMIADRVEPYLRHILYRSEGRT